MLLRYRILDAIEACVKGTHERRRLRLAIKEPRKLCKTHEIGIRRHKRSVLCVFPL